MLKRLLLFLTVTALSFGGAPMAHAHHGDEDAFFDTGPYDAAMWSQSHTEHFCVSPEFRDSGLGDAQVQNVIQATLAGAARWRTGTDIDTVINYGDPNEECNSNWSFQAGYENAQIGKSFGESVREDYCEHRFSQGSSVQYENLGWLDPDRLGLGWTCDVNDNGVIDYFIIVIDPKSNYDFNDNGSTVLNNFDYAGIITHEFGHAYGFGIHWPDDDETCPNNGLHNTMCNDAWGHFGGLGGTADSTLESHDIGEVNQAYP